MHKNFSKTEKEKIELYIQEALTFNKKHNIFIRANKDEVFEKDILDCVPLVEKIEKESKILDLGSGGGFPGVVLAILRPDCEVHLLEKSQKKCYFLNKIKDILRLDNIKVLKQTITKNNTLKEYLTITARAFSSTQNILNLTEKNLKKNGKYLLLKGRIEKIEEEMAAINTNNYKYEIIELDNKKYERHIVQIKKNE
ncbi:16S rRNA (guanine(527)-N(7))-methyltransferase RsmG [Gammaproteobacteria bacterium]|jgi:16S rRNA (guanine527-N7)-methyltransferase|nr:16S rRNA (guanine(527)-N(7))-methyltransferase RsmG [Gammaproteobacteria bacterium]MDA7690392.1 16S rRNA (guanine(527)-N(7))-methyltransferase RsmG [Gammaproteobacteria bacterium]MDA8733340.1 16S rRNA (guanine(527)-N(7))-methyltransferase RsmG [Gammaproteobacteria bacterium]MDA9561583.1 16S rRNA (guanine(527)-N(7))-methyltransferase RsmG [Gammaproteobacteria bacterium]MDB2489477.1 16S rRNA (guanine(527)-N(7))-methyltransferase RsmG [Gammaproteobacteria bacterium]